MKLSAAIRQIPAILANSLTKNLPVKLLFRRRSPAHPENDGWLVELALDRIDRTSLVEPKHFVAKVQTRDDQLQSLVHPVAALNVELRVGVEVNVAVGPFQTENGVIIGANLLVVETIKISAIVAAPEPPSHPPLIY